MSNQASEWYLIDKIEEIDSPSLLIYKERLIHNIDTMIDQVQDVSRLVPHVKTNKMLEVGKLMINKGINQFKTATIAEAEMMAMAGASRVIIAHQLVGPKIKRFFALAKQYPDTEFATIIDDITIAKQLTKLNQAPQNPVQLYLDINTGMNRSGYSIDHNILEFYQQIHAIGGIDLRGLHVYDGQHRDPDFNKRQQDITGPFQMIERLSDQITEAGMKTPEIIAGGSPAFSTHIHNDRVKVSPGTSVFWDWGYGQICQEQNFLHAALILTRIISKPATNIITVDLGHKAIAPENIISKRVKFLNIGAHELISHSEEHGVIKVPDSSIYSVGQEIYGLPYHICPTVNAYQEANVIEGHRQVDRWQVIARNRSITI